MTKRRAPLTPHLALTKVAGFIGWEKAAEIVGAKERTLRNWSDPDTSAGITLDAAIKLDIAYRHAGGSGFPMFECYSLRLKVETAESFASSEALVRAAAVAAKESGEAQSAVLAASLPGASEADFITAERELEEAISAGANTLATLRKVRRGEVQTPGGE